MELTADSEKEPYVKTQISELVSEENKKTIRNDRSING